MLKHYQTSIILCILFAAAWVRAAGPDPEENDEEDYGLVELEIRASRPADADEWIQLLESSLIRSKTKGLRPTNSINHFKTWNFWYKTPIEFKDDVAAVFFFKMRQAHLKRNSDKDVLARVAYSALDTVITEIMESVEENVDSPPLITGLQKILNDGNFLDFIAFFQNGEDEYLHRSKMLLKSSNPNMDDFARTIWNVLPRYLTRRCLNSNDEKKPNQASSSSG